MSAHSTAIGVSSKRGVWGGGNEPLKASYGKLMMWFFLLSDIFTFAAFLISYLAIRVSYPSYAGPAESFVGSNEYWPIPELVFEAVPFLHGFHAPLVFVGIMTFILIASSVTMVLAVEAGHRMAKKEVAKYMFLTIIGGLIFVGSQAWEWKNFINGTYGAVKLNDGKIIQFVDATGEQITLESFVKSQHSERIQHTANRPGYCRPLPV